jgi:hypothetical protein
MTTLCIEFYESYLSTGRAHGRREVKKTMFFAVTEIGFKSPPPLPTKEKIEN